MSGTDERWIEAESMKNQDDDDEEEFGSLFQDPDPYDTFDFKWTHQGRDICLQFKGHKQELGQTLNSTGLTLWRASNILCDFMLLHAADYVVNKNIIELGAGLGLCGILASHLGASSVILTDGDTDTLDNCRANVATNCNVGMNVSCRQLVWGRRVDEFVHTLGQYDVVMGADIIYLEQVLEPLFLQTIPKLLKDDGTFLLAYARRNVSIDLVLQFAAQAGLTFTQYDEPEGVFVFKKQL
ncbi:hypothetical protein MPSEU_000025600 [Mayamaea pseudoterrestris]|nr:hypothetical protein MPSEU_000025600 [Mayamaea pseudoterrestris]